MIFAFSDTKLLAFVVFVISSILYFCRLTYANKLNPHSMPKYQKRVQDTVLSQNEQYPEAVIWSQWHMNCSFFSPYTVLYKCFMTQSFFLDYFSGDFGILCWYFFSKAPTQIISSSHPASVVLEDVLLLI